MKIHAVGAEFRADVRTYRQTTDITKLIVPFRNFVNSCKKHLNDQILCVIRTRDHKFHSTKTCHIHLTRVLLCCPAVIT